MPKNFLEGCEAVAELCNDVGDLSPEQVDELVSEAGITSDSAAEEIKRLPQGTGIDSLAVIQAAEAADICKVCSDLGQCSLGSFLSKIE